MSQSNRVFFDEIPVDDVADSVVDDIFRLVLTKPKAVVTYINPHVYQLVTKNSPLRDFLLDTHLVYPDGWGIVLGLRWLGIPFNSRITTADFFDQFCEQAAQTGVSVGFLGGQKQTGQLAVRNLRTRFAGLDLKWIHQGFFTKLQEPTIIDKINRHKPDILLVGLGSPRQELWVQSRWQDLDVKVIWCVGGLLDYYAGKPLAPRFLGRWKLEWLFRLLTEPRRLGKRYTWGNLWFLGQLLKLKLKSFAK